MAVLLTQPQSLTAGNEATGAESVPLPEVTETGHNVVTKGERMTKGKKCTDTPKKVRPAQAKKLTKPSQRSQSNLPGQGKRVISSNSKASPDKENELQTNESGKSVYNIRDEKCDDHSSAASGPVANLSGFLEPKPPPFHQRKCQIQPVESDGTPQSTEQPSATDLPETDSPLPDNRLTLPDDEDISRSLLQVSDLPRHHLFVYPPGCKDDPGTFDAWFPVWPTPCLKDVSVGKAGDKSRSLAFLPRDSSQVGVFDRLQSLDRYRYFEFSHYPNETGRYMEEYRAIHTVGRVGLRKRRVPVLGVDLPDPYAKLVRKQRKSVNTESWSQKLAEVQHQGKQQQQQQQQQMESDNNNNKPAETRGFPVLAPVREITNNLKIASQEKGRFENSRGTSEKSSADDVQKQEGITLPPIERGSYRFSLVGTKKNLVTHTTGLTDDGETSNVRGKEDNSRCNCGGEVEEKQDQVWRNPIPHTEANSRQSTSQGNQSLSGSSHSQPGESPNHKVTGMTYSEFKVVSVVTADNSAETPKRSQVPLSNDDTKSEIKPYFIESVKANSTDSNGSFNNDKTSPDKRKPKLRRDVDYSRLIIEITNPAKPSVDRDSQIGDTFDKCGEELAPDFHYYTSYQESNDEMTAGHASTRLVKSNEKEGSIPSDRLYRTDENTSCLQDKTPQRIHGHLSRQGLSRHQNSRNISDFHHQNSRNISDFHHQNSRNISDFHHQHQTESLNKMKAPNSTDPLLYQGEMIQAQTCLELKGSEHSGDSGDSEECASSTRDHLQEMFRQLTMSVPGVSGSNKRLSKSQEDLQTLDRHPSKIEMQNSGSNTDRPENTVMMKRSRSQKGSMKGLHAKKAAITTVNGSKQNIDLTEENRGHENGMKNVHQSYPLEEWKKMVDSGECGFIVRSFPKEICTMVKPDDVSVGDENEGQYQNVLSQKNDTPDPDNSSLQQKNKIPKLPRKNIELEIQHCLRIQGSVPNLVTTPAFSTTAQSDNRTDTNSGSDLKAATSDAPQGKANPNSIPQVTLQIDKFHFGDSDTNGKQFATTDVPKTIDFKCEKRPGPTPLRRPTSLDRSLLEAAATSRNIKDMARKKLPLQRPSSEKAILAASETHGRQGQHIIGPDNFGLEGNGICPDAPKIPKVDSFVSELKVKKELQIYAHVRKGVCCSTHQDEMFHNSGDKLKSQRELLVLQGKKPYRGHARIL